MIGKKFNRLTIIGECVDKSTHFLCRCDCGKEKAIDKKSLKYNKVKSCGCLQREATGKAATKLRGVNEKDLIGQKFTRWTVLNITERDCYGQWQYECVCDCGTIKQVVRQSLLNGKSQSCGCLNSELVSKRLIERHSQNDTWKEFIGKTFDRLMVINRSEHKNNDGRYTYICRCECGKEVNVTKNNLVSKRTRSCGCLNSEIHKERFKECRESFNFTEYLNKTFNRLTIIKYDGFIDKEHRFTCQCLCGTVKENIIIHNILSGNTKSCGCIRTEIQLEGLDGYEAIVNKRERGKFTRSELRKQIIKRDSYKCFLCNCEDVVFHVHHILEWKDDVDQRFTCKNLITLCPDCHFFEAHQKIGSINLKLVSKFKNHVNSLECICKSCNLDSK